MISFSKSALKSVILSAIFFNFIASSYAAEGKWSDGFGQGNYEYSIEVKKYSLYIGCPTENGNASASSYVEFRESGKELKSFEISVGGKKYQGPFEASSRVGANNFTALLDDLRKSDAVVTFKDGSVILPKSNASSVLPSYGKKGFACNLDDVQTASKPNPVESLQIPPDPLKYGRCYGAIFAWTKKSGGKITNQRAVDFYNSWQTYAGKVGSAAVKAGGCAGNFNDSELLQCYEKRLPDPRDAKFQWAFNLGLEPVMDANGAAVGMLAQLTCGELIGFDSKPSQSSATSSSTSIATSNSTGTVTKIDTSTGNVLITGYARVTVGKSTSITVNGSRVKNEGDLLVGDRCTVRMESYDLYAQNLICTR